MKFDVVVGNPPYQENDNGKREDGSISASASPLYHYFFRLAKSISNEKVDLIFPARWLAGAGKGLGTFTTEMLNDQHVKSMTVFKNSRKVFPNTDIKGGVLYLIYDKFYKGKAQITVIDNDEDANSYQSYLNSAGSGLFIPFGELVSIYEKVSRVAKGKRNSIKSIVSTRKPYGLSTDFFKNPKKFGLPSILDTKKNDDDIQIIGLERGKRTYKYIPKDYPIPSGRDTVYKWKVFAGKAMGAGAFGERVSDLPLGKPGEIATESFIRIGSFESKYEAAALRKYYYTKFFRAMLGIIKTTQDAPARVYAFVPIQDFTQSSDIDWGKSIDGIDKQLFKKYDLSEKEIDFIETKVKPMKFREE